MDEKNTGGETKPRKLCLNCAYREACRKRFSANVANGEVLCNEHAFDISIMKKNDE